MIRIEHESDVGVARRTARDVAIGAGLDEEDAGRAALIATEAATNLARHAQSGTIFIRPLDAAEGKGVEILSIDRGPGMADIERFMTDGVSTRGTAGQGLGALRRMADTFAIDSRPGEGTIIVAQNRAGVGPQGFEVGGLIAPISEDGCGDAFAVLPTAGGAAILMVDGLGHGPDAAVAAEAAIDCFRAGKTSDLVAAFETFNEALKPTRGAAVALAAVDLHGKRVRYVGVGNISGVLHSGAKSRNMVSHNGIVGHTMRRVQQFEYPLAGKTTIVLHTDGIGTRWQPAALWQRGLSHPAIIAGHLWRAESRGRDDAAIAVLREKA